MLAVVGLVSLVSFFIINKRNQLLSNKKVVLYYLGFSLLISLGGFIGYSPATADSMMYFILLQLSYLGLGMLAMYLYRRYAPPPEEGKHDWGGVFFVLVNAFIGMIGFTLIYYYFSRSVLSPYYSLCVLPFVLPQFLNTAFKAYQAIPQEIHKIWYYPLNAHEIDFEHIDTTTIYMLELEYSKVMNDARLTNTKLRAPVAMNFGDWFRSFIENYNHKYDSDPINFLSEDGTPQGWTFFVKPSLLGTSKYIDPDRTIAENKISEKNIIIAKRVGMVDQDA